MATRERPAWQRSRDMLGNTGETCLATHERPALPRGQGPGTRDKGPGTRDQGPGTKDQGPRTGVRGGEGAEVGHPIPSDSFGFQGGWRCHAAWRLRVPVPVPVPGPWSLVPGPMVPWSHGPMVPGPWSLVPGSLSLAPGPWSLVPGPWSLVLGPWSPWSLGPLVTPWSLVPGPGPKGPKGPKGAQGAQGAPDSGPESAP